MIEGKQIIGYEMTALGEDQFTAINAATGEPLEYKFYTATTGEVDQAAQKAASAFQVYRKKTGAEKASFLEAIAEEILAIGDLLITVCSAETALPAGRLQGERMRTVNQLKMFAALLREGSWVDARIETAIPDRAPVPKPDLRYMQIALGPVVVFGASNFPLAFSVAGGDTASALAAGCPVIVKAHPAHPATSALVGKAIQNAARQTNMPDGVFSLLFDAGIATGTQLAVHPAVKAIGFTGSYKAGKALFDAAAQREVPIPVYAEMGSTNPVFILPNAIKERAAAVATAFAGSVTLGTGQFCTNPGVLVYEDEPTGFSDKLSTAFAATNSGSMLTANMLKAYETGLQHQLKIEGIQKFATGQSAGGAQAQPVLLKTNSAVFQMHPQLSEEIFGPTSTIVEASSKEDMLNIARNLTGHLTATVHGTEADLEDYKDLLDLLEQKVGRLVINGFPTGVEVCSAMMHGGPFPATADGRSTSVGTAAIFRFTRPVSYQDMPQNLLPPELRNSNEAGIYRLVNGEMTNQPI